MFIELKQMYNVNTNLSQIILLLDFVEISYLWYKY